MLPAGLVDSTDRDGSWIATLRVSASMRSVTLLGSTMLRNGPPRLRIVL